MFFRNRETFSVFSVVKKSVEFFATERAMVFFRNRETLTTENTENTEKNTEKNSLRFLHQRHASSRSGSCVR